MPSLLRIRDQPYVLLTLTSLFWAGNAVVGRAIVERVPPIALAQLRWTLAFLIVLPFAWTQLGADLPVIRRRFGILVVLGVTGIAAFNTILYWSLRHTTATNATLMQSAGPLMIGVFSWALFRDPLTRGQLAGVVISLAGVIAIVTGGEPERLLGMSLNIGDVLVLVAISIYALYSTLLRKRPPVSQISLIAVTMGVGAMVLVPLSLAEYASGERFGAIGIGELAGIGYVAVFPSILAYFFFNRGVELIGANRAGPFFYLIPLFGVGLAVLFLGERPQLYHLVGAILIIGGVAFAGRTRPAPA